MESEQSSSILVASGPPDTETVALMQAMRGAGLRVTFAGTVNLAARAGEAAACVVVLRPDTRRTQTIAVVMRAKPACLIPVLAEPMDLPRGPWTHEAISLGDEPEQAHQAIVQALRDHLATRSMPVVSPVRRVNADEFLLDTLRVRRRRNHPRLFITAILILLIVALGALGGYRYYSQAHQTSQGPNSFLVPSTVNLQNAYSAKVPGPDCDTGGGEWTQGDRYKITPTPNGTPGATPTPIEILDKYTSLQCQTDGALLTRSGDYGAYSELFFDGFGPYTSLAPHSLVQVDAKILSGDAQARLVIDTHIHNHGYGRYSFDVNTLGHWEAHTNSTDGVSYINRLAIGFFPRAGRTYTLALETDGPIMTFSINGEKVTTVRDTTYTDHDSTAFGVDDWSAKKPISALFSNFTYKELIPDTLSTPQVLATATMHAQTNTQAVYKTSVPGYGCDQNAGQWQPLTDADVPGSLKCTSDGMQLITPGSASIITSENFYLLDGNFPSNYKVAAQIDVQAATGGCAGLGTRGDVNNDFYAFIICPDGSWDIALVTAKFHSLAQGTVNAQSSYKLTALSDGSTQSLSIDGVTVGSVTDTQLKSTDHVSLLVGLYQSDQSSFATFSDFSFTPLSA